jgi:UDP:flavonoid glycosyltransferase YjiC (YdhE family)
VSEGRGARGDARPLRLVLGAFGDPGHAFPMIALGRELAARGHEVTLQTWDRWQDHVEREGMSFAAAPEYHVFPTRERPLKPYAAAVKAARETEPLIREREADAVVSDILTLAPTLAAELAGVRLATVIPHVYPVTEPGFPPYSLGARLPRTAAGRGLWRAVARWRTACARAATSSTRRGGDWGLSRWSISTEA